ncbi:MAG: hypothetical protein QG609_313 [Patescibacteria group bacterium]|nr:hypothetical protein [Patescibacteria group bacterium]
MINLSIGFIGQGWIGKNYANDFEARGYRVVRYGLEPEFLDNKEKISSCDIVFIAVPTPTTVEGFDDSIVREAVGLVGKGKVAVIKSTILPGTTQSIQKQYPDVFVLHSPEFLTESTASFDASNPQRNIIGIPLESEIYKEKAEQVMLVLPNAPYKKICGSIDAEIIKYGRNISGFFRVVFANILYDLTKNVGGDWNNIKEAMSADPDTGPTYLNPVHKSGRGAGGHCFIKDFAAFTEIYKNKVVDDKLGIDVLKSLENKNIELLKTTQKDLDLLSGVYGDL